MILRKSPNLPKVVPSRLPVTNQKIIGRTQPQVPRGAVSPLRHLSPSLRPLKINILRVKPGLGDILMLTPALRGLKEKFPNAELHLTVKRKYESDTLKGSKDNVIYEAVRNFPYIDQLRTWEEDGPGVNYDYQIDMSSAAREISYEIRGVKSPERIDIWCNYLNVKPTSKVPYIFIPERELIAIREKVESKIPISGRKIVLIHQNSNTTFRDLPVETLKRTVNNLKNYPDIFPIVISELYKEYWNIPGCLELRDLSAREFFALAAISDLIVSPDTGTLHLGGALNKKMVGLFGPTHPASRTTYYKNCTNLWHSNKCPIAPCWYSKHDCTHRSCITTITASQLTETILAKLNTPLIQEEERRSISTSIICDISEYPQDAISGLKHKISKYIKHLDHEVIFTSNNEQHLENKSDISVLYSPENEQTRLLQAVELTQYNNICYFPPNLTIRPGWLNSLLVAPDYHNKLVIPSKHSVDSSKIEQATNFKEIYKSTNIHYNKLFLVEKDYLKRTLQSNIDNYIANHSKLLVINSKVL